MKAPESMIQNIKMMMKDVKKMPADVVEMYSKFYRISRE
jgi:hypothetical protein